MTSLINFPPAHFYKGKKITEPVGRNKCWPTTAWPNSQVKSECMSTRCAIIDADKFTSAI